MNVGMKTAMIENIFTRGSALVLGGLMPFFLSALPARAQAPSKDLDRIIFKDGRTVKATVLQDDYDKVVFVKVGRAKKEEPTSKVIRIVYGGLPPAFLQASKMESQAAQGAENAQDLFENAARSYELAANTVKRPPVKALALYRAALCRMRIGLASSSLLPQAIQAFQAFLTFAPKSRFSLQARLELARCHRLAGDLEGGMKVLNAFSKRILDETLPARWDALVQLEKIRTLLAGGKPMDAAAMVDGTARALAEVNPQTEEIKNFQRELKFLEGKAKVDAKNYSSAETFFKGLLQRSDKDPAMKVVAFAGLGETYYARGLAKKSEKDLWQAYFNFGRAYAMDFRDNQMSARALYYEGSCLLALGPLKAGRESMTTAKGYFLQVVRFFPLSDFAALAAKKIK